MPHCVCATAVDRARRVIHVPASDGELVARFAGSGDPDAFAQLVRRHGPMVHAVCRRVTRHREDAEDAYQATFLVLARKAGTVNPPAAVAGWLFGVATNAAREARKRAARRWARESLVAVPPETGRCDPDPDFDSRAAVAEEVAALPERYRSLVVACDVQGEPQAAAARRLGVPVGTVYSRLSTARRMLADRLRRRGVGAAAGAAALGAFAGAAVALPPVSHCPSPNVTELTEAIMKSGFALRWKLAACVLLAGVAIGLGGEPPAPPRASAVAPPPRAADESRLVMGLGGHVRFLKSDGTEASRVTAAAAVKAGADMTVATAGEWFGPYGRAAPDGRLPLDTRKGLYMLTPGAPPVVKPVKAATGDAALFASGKVPYIVAWSPDGKRAIGFRFKSVLLGPDVYENVLIDLTAGTTAELKLPRRHRVVDWSPDGTWFLTIREDVTWRFTDWDVRTQVLCKVSADGKTSSALTPARGDARPAEMVEGAALSPDGKRVAYQMRTTTQVKDGEDAGPYQGFDVVVLDLTRGSRAVVASEPGGLGANGKVQVNDSFGVRWSPDGSRVGFLYLHREVGEPFVVGWRVGVAGADGGGSKTVFASDKTDPGHLSNALTNFDWR